MHFNDRRIALPGERRERSRNLFSKSARVVRLTEERRREERREKSTSSKKAKENRCVGKKEDYIGNFNKRELHQWYGIFKSRNNNKKEKFETFGDEMLDKEDEIIRIVSQNINCIGVYSIANHKQDKIKDWLLNNQVDIVGWQETGVAFHMLPKHERLVERMRDSRWKKMKISSANNKHENISRFQYGGNAILAFDETASRVIKTGADESGLGRWAWMLFEGKNNHKTRVISAYFPCKIKDRKKTQTVYAQHERYLNKKGINKCPREHMAYELTEKINEWQDKGEKIVLMADCNEDLSKKLPIQKALTQKCQLVDPIREIYQTKNNPLPPSTLTGSKPIDCILVSSQLRNIVKGGWLEVGEGIGDHRPIYVDIPNKLLLGEHIFKIQRPEIRRLTCDQPKVVDKFVHLLRKQMKHQKIFDAYNKLAEVYNNDEAQDDEFLEKLNKVDRSMTNAIRYAEKRCRKLTMGGVPYTPERTKAGNMIGLWTNIVRKKNGHNISSRYIKRQAKQLGVHRPMELKIEDCEKEKMSAIKEYRKIKRNAAKNRRDFINEKATQQAANGNESVGNAIRRLNRLEEERESRRRIKIATKSFAGATMKILLENTKFPEKTRTTTDKDEIEKALRKENTQKFTLAYSSPFLNYPLKNILGQDATTLQAEEMLNGTFNKKLKISKETKKFIKCLEKPDSIKKVGDNDSMITVEQVQYYWKKKREKTSSSMSQRHIGTYKAMATDQQIMQIINGIGNMAYNTGIALERWTNDLDVSLLKRPNKIRPEDLRTIGQLEADFNQQASMHFSKRMIDTGIEHNEIPESQYAKKGCRSIEAAIVKIMFFDHLRMNRKQGAFIAMDLMQCFDRMAHPITSIAAQRLGVPKKIIKCMINALVRMKHFVRTAYGDSDRYYIGKKEMPFQGAIQGNGAASPLFVAISCLILAYLEKCVTGVEVITAITMTLITITAIMYVDDTDILIAAKEGEGVKSIVKKAKMAAKAYMHAVHQTGGALRPHKCNWYLITIKWTGGKWRYGKTNEDVATLRLKNTDGKKEIVKRKEAHEGLKGLGVVVSPDGSWEDQMKELLEEKIIPWNNSIKTSYLYKHDVYRSAFESIFKSVEYILPATSFNERQCNRIDAQIHNTFLPKIGVDTHLPLAYRYAPTRYQGLGSMNIEVQQLIEKIKIFLPNAGQDTQMAHFIKSQLESLHLLLGTNRNIFDLKYDRYGMLVKNEKGWLVHLWENLKKFDVEIKGTYTKTTGQRVNDFALMDKAIDSGLLNSEQLKKINRCRVYLRVQQLSDIATGKGDRVIQQYMEGNIERVRESKYSWPEQRKPTKSDWQEWSEAIKNIWTENEQGLISPPLGEWIYETHQITKWSYDVSTDTVYKEQDYMHKAYSATKESRHGKFYTYKNRCMRMPMERIQAFVTEISNKKVSLDSVVKPRKQPNVECEEKKRFYKYIVGSKNEQDIVEAIRNKYAVAVCDSSVLREMNIGTASWILMGKGIKNAVTGDHGVPNGSNTIDPYRGELYGIYAVLKYVKDFTEKHEIQSGGITIACDNDASLQHAIEYNRRAPIKCSTHDILWAIYDLKKDMNIEIKAQRVEGHRDDYVSMEEMNIFEQLNCYVDKRAKKFRKYITGNNEYEYSKIHSNNLWQCSINETIITENISSNLKIWTHGARMQRYLEENKKYNETAFGRIHWDAVEKATNSLTNTRRIWLAKFVSGFCGVAKKMHQRKAWDSPMCPLCHIEEETTTHVITCNDGRVREKYANATSILMKHMERFDTHPAIVQVIIKSIQEGKPTFFSQHVHPDQRGTLLHKAAQAQDKIGWQNFFKGHIAQEWSIAQHRYTNKGRKNPPSPTSWAKNIIIGIYKFSLSMWENRNNIVHEKNDENVTIREAEEINSLIQEQYDLGNEGLKDEHRMILESTIEETLELTISEKKYWIETLQASRKYVDLQEKNIYDSMREVVARWS